MLHLQQRQVLERIQHVVCTWVALPPNAQTPNSMHARGARGIGGRGSGSHDVDDRRLFLGGYDERVRRPAIPLRLPPPPTIRMRRQDLASPMTFDQWETGRAGCITLTNGRRLLCFALPRTCHSCIAGWSQPKFGQSACDKCGSGTVSNEVSAATACIICPAGRTNDPSNTTYCPKCRAGFHQSQPGMMKCENCSKGEYAPGEQQTRCSICKPGTPHIL